ncbi:MAG: hypothetical protein GX262_04675 [Clostridia bacterium]|nr:hypothetical protein [Clostridia bacterium]
MKKFIPVRILNKDRAESFIKGEIFMRQFSNFGAWNRLQVHNDKEINNNYRGDLGEGIVENIAKPLENKLLSGIDPELLNVTRRAYLVDYGGTQLFNLLCLTCLDYDEERNWFKQPHQDLRLFGDTAVVIIKMDTFLRRMIEALADNPLSMLMDQITYYPKDKSMKMPNSLFFKDESYAWENELRIAVGHLDVNNHYVRNNNGKWPLKDMGNMILKIGDISDIVKAPPIEEFISGEFLNTTALQFPMSENGNTIFDNMVADTRKALEGFQGVQARLMIVIE